MRYEDRRTLQRIERKLDRILDHLNVAIVMEELEMIDLNNLRMAVQNETTVEAGVATLVQQIVTFIQNIPPSSDAATQAELDDLVGQLSNSQSLIGNDVTAGTSALNPAPPSGGGTTTPPDDGTGTPVDDGTGGTGVFPPIDGTDSGSSGPAPDDVNSQGGPGSSSTGRSGRG